MDRKSGFKKHGSQRRYYPKAQHRGMVNTSGRKKISQLPGQKPIKKQQSENKSKLQPQSRKKVSLGDVSEFIPFHYENEPGTFLNSPKKIKTNFKNEDEQLNFQAKKVNVDMEQRRKNHDRMIKKLEENYYKNLNTFKKKKEECQKYTKTRSMEIYDTYLANKDAMREQFKTNLAKMQDLKNRLTNIRTRRKKRGELQVSRTLNYLKKLDYQSMNIPKSSKDLLERREEAELLNEVRKQIPYPPKPTHKKGEPWSDYYERELDWLNEIAKIDKQREEDPVKWAKALHKEVQGRNTSRGVRFSNVSKIREVNRNTGTVKNLKNVRTKENTKNYTLHQKKLREIENAKKSTYNKLVEAAGTTYDVVCDALGKCLLRRKAKSGTLRRATNSRGQRTRKANRTRV